MRTSTCIPALLLAASLAAQSRIYTVRPRVASRLRQTFGRVVAGPGDVNADGYPDFFVGGEPTKENPFNAWVYSGRTGTLLHAFAATPDPLGKSQASSIAGAGDVDRDGHADLIVGMERHGKNGTGMVRVYSGKDGRLLYTFRGTGRFVTLGYRVNGAGDVNRDGYDDFIASAFGFSAPGFVRVWSGKDGRVLYTIPGGSGLHPEVVGPAGDLDRDGFADFLASYLAIPTSFLEIRSGRTGKVLRRFTGTATAGRPTGPVCLAGDVDRDGFPDYVLLAAKINARGRYTVVVLSGKAWRVVHEIPASADPDLDLVRISGYGDRDRDGRDDLAVLMGPGRVVKIFSGKDASLLWTSSFKEKVVTIGAVGDVDRDGIPDLIAGAPYAELAHVLSGRQLALTSDVHLLSLASGGKQTLSLDAGLSEAGRSYWVLGSVTGTRPGTRLGGLLLPLNFDGYTALTLALPNSLLLRSTLGRLDPRGRASASFNLPPGLGAALRGLTLHHAFLTFTPTTLRTASNAVPLTLIR